MALHSDGISEVLKFILLGVIGLCLVGLLFWYISDKYPIYSAKKEVSITLNEIANAYMKWASKADEPVTMDYMTSVKNWVIIDKETKDHWVFDLVGDPATKAVAQSTQSMPGGRDRFVWIDIQSGKMWGWGIPATEDSIKNGLLKLDSIGKPPSLK